MAGLRARDQFHHHSNNALFKGGSVPEQLPGQRRPAATLSDPLLHMLPPLLPSPLAHQRSKAKSFNPSWTLLILPLAPHELVNKASVGQRGPDQVDSLWLASVTLVHRVQIRGGREKRHSKHCCWKSVNAAACWFRKGEGQLRPPPPDL